MTKFFRDPHTETQHIGTFPITIHYRTSKKYPKTCSALSNLADVTSRDDLSKRNGHDNYCASLEKLLHSFDTFIREKSQGKSSAGKRENYDLSNNCHFTILLLWQIRNTLAHQGGIIDHKCKQKYDRLFRKRKSNVNPVIELPDTINVGQIFTVGFQDFVTIQKCVFSFFKNHISDGDYEIFKIRAFTNNYKITNVVIPIEFEEGTLFLDLEQAVKHGFEFHANKPEIIPPDGAEYFFSDGKIHLPNGTSFSAKFEKRA